MFTVNATTQSIAKVIVTLATLDTQEEFQYSIEEVRERYLKNQLCELTTVGIYLFQGIRMEALYVITGRKFLNQESLEQWHRTFDRAVNYLYGN